VARINIDDGIESRPEYKKLLKLCGGCHWKTMGMLVDFWRIAQKYWAEGNLVPQGEIDFAELQPVVDARWGLPREGNGDIGIYAIGSEERFAWLIQKQEAGRKGGLKKAENKAKKPSGGLAGASVAVAETKRGPSGAYPLVLSPSPSPSQKQIQGTPQSPQGGAGISPEDMTQALEEWGRTLKHYGRDRNPRLDEVQIYGLLKSKGLPRLRNALRGFCGEVKGDGYDPAKHMNIMRLTKSDSFSHLEALGESLANEAIAKPRKNRAKPDCEQCRGVGMYLPPLDEDSDSSTNVMKSCECAEEQTA